MLNVSKFKLIGNEGSSTFGRPLGIAEQPDLLAVMAKLNNLLAGKRNAPLQIEQASPIRSQIDPFGIERGQSSPVSSAGPAFATQDPAGTFGRGSGEAANKKHPPSGKEHLLSILLEQKKAEEPSIKDNKGSSKVGGSQETNNTHETSNSLVLGSLGCEKVIGASSKLDNRAKKTDGECFVPQPPIEDTNEQDLSPAEIKYPQQRPATSFPSNDSEKENSQEGAGLEHLRLSKAPDLLHTVNHEDHAMQALVLDDDTHGNLFQGLKRIPRSYVRVPEQQRAVLERNNSWFRPRNHTTSSYINNIPPTVLEDLNLFANRIAAPRNTNANDLRSEHRIRNDDASSDIDEMDAEAEQNEEHSDIENTPGSVALGKADSISSKHGPMGEPGPGTPKEGDGTCSTIRSSQDVDMDDSNEHVNDEQDEIGEESSMQLSPSPERDHGFNIRAVPESSNAGLPSSPAELEMNDELPRMSIGRRSISTDANVKTARLINATFPSSSLPSEAELQMEELHAIDEPIDEHADEKNVSQDVVSEPPSTAAEDGIRHTIQVEASPSSNLQNFEKPTAPSTLPKGKKRRIDEISSDPVSPCTASDGRPQIPQQSSTSVEFRSQSTSASKETDRNASRVISTQASVDEGVDPDQDSIPDHLPPFEVEGTQSTCELQGTSNELKKATPLNREKGNFTTFPAPQPDPLEGDRMLEARELRANRDSIIPESPQQPRRKSRKALRFSNWKFSQDEYTARDTDEMARASRRDFSAKFAALKAEESDPITNTPLPTSTISQPDPDSTPCNIPATSSDVSQPTGPDTPAAEQSHTTSLVESTPSISVASPNVLESQMIFTVNDKTERVRQIVVNAQPSKDASIASNLVPQLATQHTAYDKFILAYPDYQGTEEQFINGLVYMEWLVNKKGKNFLRKSLWDDLLRVLADDYVDYIQGPTISGQRMKGLEFYNELDQDPVFKKLIITPSNLEDFILSLNKSNVEEVRRVYGIGQKPKDMASAEMPPRSEQLTASKPPTPDRPRIQEAEKDLQVEEPENTLQLEEPEKDFQVDEESAVMLQEQSLMPVIQADDQSATSKPLFFETRSQVQEKQTENAPGAVASTEKTFSRPINNSAERMSPEPLSPEMHSQTQADEMENTFDNIIESAEDTPTRRFKNPRRSLPWAVQSSTTVPSETQASPGSLHVHRRFSELPSKSWAPQPQAQNEKPSDFGRKPTLKARSSMPSAEDYDPFTSPEPRALNTTARKFKSLPDTRVAKPAGARAIRDAGSARKIEFLTEFARNQTGNQMSAKPSHPPSKRIKRF